MLELINLTKRFKGFYAVKKMNIYIEKGEIVGLLGPNGAGKSTAISMLSSLVEPLEGDVVFNKKSILKNPSPLRKVTGIVPQEIALYNDLSAEENLYFFGRIYRLKGKELKEKVAEVLELTGLTERKKTIVKNFSGGMKRRLNIGVALLHDPELLIMDEPTVGIDTQSRNYILETVKQLNTEKQMTILYTSHYMEEVEFLCDRIYIMDEGSLIASGTKDELKQILSAEQTIVIKANRINGSFTDMLKQEPAIKRIDVEKEKVTIIVPKEMNVFKLVLQIAANAQIELHSIEIQTPTLEDVFLHLTGKGLRN